MQKSNHLGVVETTDLFILRTNLQKRTDFSLIRESLLKLPGVRDCTIDLDDRDRVLRVKCEGIPLDTIIAEVVRHGFFCEELGE